MKFNRRRKEPLVQSVSNETLASGKEDLPPKELIVLVMGPTGSGKSSFINVVLQNEENLEFDRNQKDLEVGHNLTSCTREVETRTVVFSDSVGLQKYRVTLVDTPGFDDTYETDMAILKKIAAWVEDAYRQQRILGGIIYLHDISHNRFTGTCRKNLKLFQQMCGEATFEKIVIGTTHWKKLENMQGVGESHTKELCLQHWKGMLDKGCRSVAFADSPRSALSFLEILTSRITDEIFMQIQKELVDEKKCLQETAAARELSTILEHMFQLRKEAADLEARMDRGGSAEDKERLEEAKRNIKAITSQIRELKTPLGRRLKRFFGLT